MPIIELVGQNFVPRVFAGSGTAGQRKQVSAIGHTARGAGLNGGCADLVHADNGEDGGEGFDFFFINIAMGFDCDIPAREARAAGGPRRNILLY